jgi:hypothetical protein
MTWISLKISFDIHKQTINPKDKNRIAKIGYGHLYIYMPEGEEP